jgi:hypothetical protein
LICARSSASRPTAITAWLDNLCTYIKFSPTSCEVGIDQARPGGIEVFPHPVHRFLQIRSDQPMQALRIIASGGREVFHRSLSNENSLEIDTGFLPEGLYFVELNADGQRLTKKFLLVK